MKKPNKKDFQRHYKGELVFGNIDDYVSALEKYIYFLEEKKQPIIIRNTVNISENSNYNGASAFGMM